MCCRQLSKQRIRILVAGKQAACPLSGGCSVLGQDLPPPEARFYHCLPSGLALTLGIKLSLPQQHLAGEVLPAQLPTKLHPPEPLVLPFQQSTQRCGIWVSGHQFPGALHQLNHFSHSLKSQLTWSSVWFLSAGTQKNERFGHQTSQWLR